MFMNFDKFLKAVASDEAKKKAMEGFHERQVERERQFQERAKLLEPKPGWENRRYTI